MKSFYDLFPFPKEDVDKIIDGLKNERKIIICNTFGILGFERIKDRDIAKLVGCKTSEIPTRRAYIIRFIQVELLKLKNMPVEVLETRVR